MNAEVPPVAEEGQHGVGDAADAHLQRGAVLDQAGAELGDPVLLFAAVALVEFERGIGDRDDVGQPGHVDEAVAEGARHAVVDLGDDHPGRFGGGLGQADLDAQAAKAVLVRRAEMNQGRVEGKDAMAKQARHLGQETRRVVCTALVDGPAHIGAGKIGRAHV